MTKSVCFDVVMSVVKLFNTFSPNILYDVFLLQKTITFSSMIGTLRVRHKQKSQVSLVVKYM